HSDVAHDQKIERLWMDSLNQCFDLFGLAYTRREKHVRACLRVSLKPAERFAEGVRMAHVIAFGSSCEQYIATGVIYCLPRGLKSCDGNRQIEQWMRRISSRILN